MARQVLGDSVSNRIDPDMLETVHRDHLDRYRFVKDLAVGKRVLEIGCALGYGSAQLAAVASEVFAIDTCDTAIEYARFRYAGTNLTFQKMDACSLALEDKSFDLAVSFEVIEHVTQAMSFLASIRKVLKPGGMAVLSTPNRLVASPNGILSDPTHVCEYSPLEFAGLLRSAGFCEVCLYGQHLPMGVWKVHGLSTGLSRLDIFGLRRWLSGRWKSWILANIVRIRFGKDVSTFAATQIDQDLGSAMVQIAVCRV
jgi:SAM-dependent methyltransferase